MNNNSYKNYLLDLITIISERYNDTLMATPNTLAQETDSSRVCSELIYYDVIDLMYQQLIVFQLNDDLNMAEPVIGQQYIPFAVPAE